MQLEQPALLYDGGYWYVVPVSFDEEGRAIVDLPDSGGSIHYSEDLTKAVIRSPVPVIGLKILDTPVSSVINGAMPRARIKGI